MSSFEAGLAAAIRVAEGKGIDLKSVDPAMRPNLEKSEAKKCAARDAKAIDELQDRLYAERQRSLLVVLQGMDASGKDGTIRAVFNVAGPVGVHVTSFRAPSADELARDFLWRVHKAVPGKGTIGIFNRSHYEDVLVVKVKRLAPLADIEQRYDQINRFERHLSENGTRIVKFMLHISKEEQAKRFRDRLDTPRKQWKFNPGDLQDRKLWDDYMAAYETMLARCSTDFAPWYVVPADRNWVRNWTVAHIVRQTLQSMNPEHPKPNWTATEFEID